VAALLEKQKDSEVPCVSELSQNTRGLGNLPTTRLGVVLELRTYYLMVIVGPALGSGSAGLSLRMMVMLLGALLPSSLISEGFP
jgi:hypothetical protein